MAAIWRKLFEGEEGTAQLKPGGRYYTEAARSLGVPSSGPLNPGMLYSFPNPFMQYVGDGGVTSDEHNLHFCYDAAADELVYSHAGGADMEDADGEGLARSSSARLKGEAMRSWRRDDFLRAACLRPGGLLYMNAVDSFGQLEADRLYFFPHFGPVKADHFRYRPDIDALELDAAEQSDFVKRATISPGKSTGGLGAAGTGGSSLGGGGSTLGGGGGTLGSPARGHGTPLAEPEPEREPEAGAGTMTDTERARLARLRRYG